MPDDNDSAWGWRELIGTGNSESLRDRIVKIETHRARDGEVWQERMHRLIARMDGQDARMAGTEQNLADLRKEVQTGFARADQRSTENTRAIIEMGKALERAPDAIAGRLVEIAHDAGDKTWRRIRIFGVAALVLVLLTMRGEDALEMLKLTFAML